VRRPPRRPGRAGEDDAEHVAALVPGDQLPEREQLLRRLRREPRPEGVEDRDVSAAHVEPALERLDERRPPSLRTDRGRGLRA
jgi:hypothetical protein